MKVRFCTFGKMIYLYMKLYEFKNRRSKSRKAMSLTCFLTSGLKAPSPWAASSFCRIKCSYFTAQHAHFSLHVCSKNDRYSANMKDRQSFLCLRITLIDQSTFTNVNVTTV